MSDSPPATGKRNYKGTLNLPHTRFAMKADLVQREPRFQARWDELGVYERVRELRAGRTRWVLHDGPPYANGSIHMGHLLNKVLKDIVVRSRNMLGYDSPFIPGWDCHGLPIEHRVLKELGKAAHGLAAREIRARCQAEAGRFMQLQAQQMRRLGTLGDYAHPYFTMSPGFEAATLEVFAALVGKGLVYRALRPVHWSIANRTALADHELEYEDRQDPSVFVHFEVVNPQALPRALAAPAGQRVSLLIWTTTPWTLPANLAVAVSPAATYGLYRLNGQEQFPLAIVATSLEAAVLSRATAGHERLGTCSGADLAASGVRYRHPFVERESPVVTADYVTLEDGTGLVHTAPGHGTDDFLTGTAHGLDIYCPVLENGRFDDSVPEWLRGVEVWDGNPKVLEHLRSSGHLFHHELFTHSYPHDWRSKTPTIFRATEQWFVAVDREGASIREAALEATAERVQFIPEWGRNRMRGMLESRPEWCISRQRAWGLPIPAFFGQEPGQLLLTEASVRAVSRAIAERGSDRWLEASAAELLSGYDAGRDPAAPAWVRADPGFAAGLRKSEDIFDVWFESGSSWHAVIERAGLGHPVDLYLEGSDQHRGWFQLSLLTSLGVTGQPPFRAILTHGFIVDKQGRKMSKSLGNTLEVDDLMKQLGADICRFWVASLNTENDVKVDLEQVRLAGEEYRKVRNTIRFLLSNLGDFDPATHRRELTAADAASVDGWAMERLGEATERVRAAYESCRLRKVHETLFHFCNDTLSAVYLAAVKDRLYCDATDSDRRRRTQTVFHEIASSLIHLVAPVLVHTADEAWLALAGDDPDAPRTRECIHFRELPPAVSFRAHADWESVMSLRERVMKTLEDERERQGIKNPLDTGVRVTLPAAERARLGPFEADMADLCGVSRFAADAGAAERIAIDDLREEPRCERSWKRDGTVRERSDGGLLTDRDAAAVGV